MATWSFVNPSIGSKELDLLAGDIPASETRARLAERLMRDRGTSLVAGVDRDDWQSSTMNVDYTVEHLWSIFGLTMIPIGA